MVAMTGGRGPAMTGGPAYIRDGAAPYREPGSRKPEDAFAVLLAAGANPNAKAPDGNSLLHQAARAGNLEMIRALATAKVDFDSEEQRRLHRARCRRRQAAARAAGGPRRAASGRTAPWRARRHASRTSRSCCAS